jgi:hypothetical protein
VGAGILAKAHQFYGESRSDDGRGSELDFVEGPLAAALFAFKGWDELSYDLVESVRSYTVPAPIFGPVTFTAILTEDGGVVIVDFDEDPDYWQLVGDDPSS